MSALRYHRADGTPVLVDLGPQSPGLLPGWHPHTATGLGSIPGRLVRGEPTGRVRESHTAAPEDLDNVRELNRQANQRRRARHREAYNAYMREYAAKRRAAAREAKA